jgi:F-type H+-transporting ATPase subunit delta
MADHVTAGYAAGLLEVLRAEGIAERVEDELFRAARTIEGDRRLRSRLTDPQISVGTRLEVIDELFGGRAHPQTVAALLWLVAAGRARQVGEIADELARRGAASREASLAEVRSAVELDDRQRERLKAALERNLGREVELRVVVDPDVVGGLVVRVGDTVIDGSLASRLEDVRTRLIGT